MSVSDRLNATVKACIRWLFPCKPRRLELRFVSYEEGDRLIRESYGAWTVAPEEDTNQMYGMVYLERLER